MKSIIKLSIVMLILSFSVLLSSKTLSTKPTYKVLFKSRTPRQPKQVIFSADMKYIIVTCLSGRGVEIYNTKDLKHVRTIRTKNRGTTELTYNVSKTEIWVSQMFTSRVYVLDATTFNIKKIIPTKGVWSKIISFRPDGKIAYVSNWLSNDISVIDTEKYRVIKVVKMGHERMGKIAPRGICFTPNGKFAYVCCFGNGKLIKMDAWTHEIIRSFTIGGHMRHIVITKNGKTAYMSNMKPYKVYVFNIPTDRFINVIPVGSNPNTIELTNNDHYLYVSCREANCINVIDTSINKVVDIIQTERKPTALALSPDNRYLCYSNFASNNIVLLKINWGKDN